jgi:bacteriorhodopsin
MGAPMSSFSVDDPAKAFLSQDDYTAISFWIISIAMIATTVFLYSEARTVVGHWKTSVHVGGLVTLVAAVHYMYMREYWVAVKASPIVYRYIDWTITVPLQMIEFNLIIKAAGGKIGSAGFWKLLIGTVFMLAFGFFGEINKDKPSLCQMGFGLGMCGWAFILFEIFAGESAKACPQDAHVKQAFTLMKLIVSLGWSIYPAGYYFGTISSVASAEALNVIYNIADFVNKIAFVLCCWSCAKSASEGKTALLA